MSDRDLLIGQVAATTGLNRPTIRYYEEVGLLPKPRRRPAGYASVGYRLYSAEDVECLGFIKGARVLGLSLAEIKQLLTSLNGAGAQQHLDRTLQEKLSAIDIKIQELQLLRDRLERIRSVIVREKVAVQENCCDPLCDPHICPPPLVKLEAARGVSTNRIKNSNRRQKP